MGNQLFDHYSPLHAATGLMMFYWSIPLFWALVLHTIFEVVENTKAGIGFIDRFLTTKRLGWFGWPGGKDKPDSFLNSLGDTIAFAAGWLLPLAYWPSGAKLPVETFF